MIALQVGHNDTQSLRVRAGPDASVLAEKSAAVFGLGALGGNVALLLAESGVGSLILVDSEQVLPENVVRHVAGHGAVGHYKVSAVESIISDHAPWVTVECIREQPKIPSRLEEIFSKVNVIVDATGTEAATQAFVACARSLSKPLISGALYRGGAVARIQRQAAQEDTPIAERGNHPNYPQIPPGEVAEEMVYPPIGCSTPIHNAPPSSVTACASLIVQSAVDHLTDSHDLPDEVIAIYRPLSSDPPFNEIGMFMPSR